MAVVDGFIYQKRLLRLAIQSRAMMENFQQSAGDFTSTILPLYDGPRVRLRVAASESTYVLSENLLRKESPFLASQIDVQPAGLQQRVITLENMEGIVSKQSVEALIQWMYRRVVVFDIYDPENQIDAAIELVRLADTCGVEGLGDLMAKYIRNILRANPHPKTALYWRPVDTNTYCLVSRHIVSASHLPTGHPVRRVLAEACVEGYLRDHNHKFAQETREYPSFGADVLAAVSPVLQELHSTTNIAFTDPISKQMVEIRTSPKVECQASTFLGRD